MTIAIAHDAPGPGPAANWLPAPAGLFTIVARVYVSEESVLNGTWRLPPLEVVGAAPGESVTPAS